VLAALKAETKRAALQILQSPQGRGREEGSKVSEVVGVDSCRD